MTPNPLFPREDTLGINTDLYELTMAAAYFSAGRVKDRASFELFTRKMPSNRSFLLAAGLEQALHYLQNVRFSEESIEFLRKLETFKDVDPAFFDYLREFRFTGDVCALPEGTIFFADEPVLQVTAPIIEAQIAETYLINVVNFQSTIASKAARVCLAGRGKLIVDFGSRRAHSPQAGVMAARAAYIGGCQGTSNVLAGYEMGIPVYGTMAHSFVQFFEQEEEAFRRFHEVFGATSIMLVDTYDTLEGVERALRLDGEIGGVRLDSGDLLELSRKTRRILDTRGASEVRIIASGNLDEEKILALTLADAPIDGYGVGTDLVVSTDAPTCDLIYKLVAVLQEEQVSPRMKSSEGKATLPYRKQIFRKMDGETFAQDLVARHGEEVSGFTDADGLLEAYMKAGELIRDLPTVSQIRDYAQAQISRLPGALKLLHTAEEYPVEYTGELSKIRKELRSQLA